MMDTTACPACGELAEVRDRSVLESTDGPIEHGKVFCVRGHWFQMPIAGLASPPLRRGEHLPARKLPDPSAVRPNMH